LLSCRSVQDVTPARKVVQRQERNRLAPAIGSQPRAAITQTRSADAYSG
jgi:hypothetical protein